MGFKEGKVHFDCDVFYAGQTVTGKLVFREYGVRSFRSLYVVMKGYCRCRWTTSHTKKVEERLESYTKHHNAHETYFEYKVYLMKSTYDGECRLNPGRHEFPFHCHLPPHCPSSYEGSDGHIRYEFRFVFDNTTMTDHEKVERITVVAKRDLNEDPIYKQPINFEFLESYCCCCVSFGACEVLVKVPQSGYCPGEGIPIEVSCENRSTVAINSIKFTLKKYTTFFATDEPGKKTGTDVVQRMKIGPIPSKTAKNWDLVMAIPEVDVSNVDTCHFIDIDYEFEIEICPSGCHESTREARRILLGHKPTPEAQLLPPQYPAPNQPYPVVSQVYHNTYPQTCSNPAYPGANPAYPDANTAYPDANPNYYGTNPANPDVNPTYYRTNPAYADENPMYLGINPAYP